MVDIAIVRLNAKDELVFGNYNIQPICLPNYNAGDFAGQDGKHLIHLKPTFQKS
jgi:hypothetical protein